MGEFQRARIMYYPLVFQCDKSETRIARDSSCAQEIRGLQVAQVGYTRDQLASPMIELSGSGVFNGTRYVRYDGKRDRGRESAHERRTIPTFLRIRENIIGLVCIIRRGGWRLIVKPEPENVAS